MNLDFSTVNWLAVLVAGLATFFLGGVWYQALFGKLWVRLNGYTPEEVKAMQKSRPPAIFFGGMIGAYLLLSVVMAVMMGTFGIKGWSGGAMFGFLLWLGPAIAIGFTAWLASNKHIGVFMIDWAYQVVFLVMMGAILGAWR